MRFFNISQCPSLPFPFQSPFITRSNSNGPRCHSLRPSTPPSLPPSCPPYFFPTIFHPAPLFYLYLPFYPPIYFPLIFSTSLHPLLYLSSLCFPRLSQRAHLYLIPRPKCASLPILCAPPRAHLHTNMHASRRSHKWPHNTNDPHRCMSGM